MRARLLLLVWLLSFPGVADAREKWDTQVLSLVPSPGYPAHAYVHPQGRFYAGTYDNPSGDTVPSRVFEWDGAGTLLRSWTVRGQDLSGPHGVQGATSDARGRLVLLDKSPPRPAHQAILDVEAGEPGLPELIPANAGPRDAAAPRITRLRAGGRRLKFRLSEPAAVRAVARFRKDGNRRVVSTRATGLRRGRHSLRFRLHPGRWRLTVAARDAGGNRSRVVKRVRIR